MYAEFRANPFRKIFSINWWNSVDHPLGGPFTLSPEDYTYWPGTAGGVDNYFLGYSIEKTCLRTPFAPFDSRPRQAFVYAKFLHYFTGSEYILRDDPSPTDFFSTLAEAANMTFLARFEHDIDTISPPPGITELERLDRPAFQSVIARSRVVMGVGSPWLSPTPWEALCLGVPFVNPVKEWDKAEPDNREKWVTQHDGVLHYGYDEPYAYHVKLGDRAGLETAVIKAMERPIER